MRQEHREWLTDVKPIADRKLRQLGIPLSYTIEFVDSESDANGTHIKLNPRDRSSKNFRDKSKLHLMLHELARIFFDKFIRHNRSTVDDPETKSLFGSLTKAYLRKPGPKKGQPFFLSKYAQSHPEEDLAEVFATYVMLDGNMGRIRHHLLANGKSERVYRQVEWLDRFIRSVASLRRSRV